MEMRRLGKTGPMVGVLGLGTAKFGRDLASKYPRDFALPDDATVTRLLAEARALGMNLLDTAPAYGSSEARLGALLGSRRPDWVIVSKAGEEFDAGSSSFNFSAAAIRASVERSLKRLRTDWLDAVLIHSDGIDEAGGRFDAAVGALDTLKRDGKIRLTGFSSKTRLGGLAMAECVDVLMATFNANYLDDLAVIDRAASLGRGVLLKKVLDSGHAGDPGAALRAALALRGGCCAVVGTISPAHLVANAAAIAGQGG